MAGGRSSFIHIWKMENRQLLRIIQLPSKVRQVKQLVFLTNNFDGGSSEVVYSVLEFSNRFSKGEQKYEGGTN